MAAHYYTHKTLPNTALVRDPSSGAVVGSIGYGDVGDFVADEWKDHGPKTIRDLNAEASRGFPKHASASNKEKVFKAALAAGHSAQVAIQLSGYTGKD